MMKSIGREIASGLVIVTGIGIVVLAAGLKAPLIAMAGAVAALVAGVYQAVSAPRRKRVRPTLPTSLDDDGESKQHVPGRKLVGRL